MSNNMIFAFVFDSGKLGVSYGEEVFRNILSGTELSRNSSKMIVSWGDILIHQRHVDIEPYVHKNEYCTIDFDSLNSNNAFQDYPFCWIVEDIHVDNAILLDNRLKASLYGYIGMSRIDPSNTSESKQFWKKIIRSIAIFGKTITCFQDPNLTDTFCYAGTADELGYNVEYAPEAEYGIVEDTPILQSSFIETSKDLKIYPSKISEVDRNLITMNFALRQELQISGTLIWKSINNIENIAFHGSETESDHLFEYAFLSLYHASQGIERIQKAIIELICKKKSYSRRRKAKSIQNSVQSFT